MDERELYLAFIRRDGLTTACVGVAAAYRSAWLARRVIRAMRSLLPCGVLLIESAAARVSFTADDFLTVERHQYAAQDQRTQGRLTCGKSGWPAALERVRNALQGAEHHFHGIAAGARRSGEDGHASSEELRVAALFELLHRGENDVYAAFSLDHGEELCWVEHGIATELSASFSRVTPLVCV